MTKITARFALALIALAMLAGQCLAASLYVTEFTIGASVNTQVAKQPALVEQVVTISASSTQSAAFSGDTRLIRVHCDSICSIKIGASPTATTSTMRLPTDGIEYFEVKPGDKIAVIANN